MHQSTLLPLVYLQEKSLALFLLWLLLLYLIPLTHLHLVTMENWQPISCGLCIFQWTIATGNHHLEKLSSSSFCWQDDLTVHTCVTCTYCLGTKMVSLFLNLPFTHSHFLHSHRHATPEQQFSLCANPVGEGPHSCDHIGWMELTIWPLIYYLIWQIFYLVVVCLWS